MFRSLRLSKGQQDSLDNAISIIHKILDDIGDDSFCVLRNEDGFFEVMVSSGTRTYYHTCIDRIEGAENE